jgi:hypothetical protein
METRLSHDTVDSPLHVGQVPGQAQRLAAVLWQGHAGRYYGQLLAQLSPSPCRGNHWLCGAGATTQWGPGVPCTRWTG